MSEILYLNRAEVASLLPGVLEQIDLAERTYRAIAAGRVELPPKPGIHPRLDAFIHAMPAFLMDDDVAALKWVSGYPGNAEKGLPYISGVIVVNDAETGAPTAIMDAAEITAARTAAASGVCVRAFAPEGWRTAAILGCGEQGRYHASVLRTLNPELRVQAYDPRRERIAELGQRVEAAPDAQSAVAGAQVVVTAGPIVKTPHSPLVPGWLDRSYVALPIDFDFYFRAETIRAGDLFLVDDVGQFEYYREQGHFSEWPEPDASVGEALGLRDRPGRVACVNLGVGALDAAFAKHVVDAAGRQGAGVRLPA